MGLLKKKILLPRMKTSIEAKLDKLDGKANKRHYEIYSSNACYSQYHLNENCVPKILQFSMYNEDVIALIILVSYQNKRILYHLYKRN